MEKSEIQEEIKRILTREDDAVWGKRQIKEKADQIVEILSDQNYSFVRGILREVERRLEDSMGGLAAFRF